jgi:hypothetical protein
LNLIVIINIVIKKENAQVESGFLGPAVGTEPEKDHAVACERETVGPGLLFLEFFYSQVEELHLHTTHFANKMIVMSMPVPRFVSSDSVPKVDFPGQAGLGKEFHGTVNRGLAYVGVAASYDVAHLVGGNVAIAL